MHLTQYADVVTVVDSFSVPDGLSEIEPELPLIMTMIARTARWVHPETFKALPIWCPDTARGMPRYDAVYSRVCKGESGRAKVEENIRAGNALLEALGIRGRKPPNWTVCHIWGYDDEKFAGKSRVVQDPRYYSCIGNMVWLPTPLKGFTDAVPAIKECLRVCAFHLYGWVCEHDDAKAKAERVRAGEIPRCYPDNWPTADRSVLPAGVAPYNAQVKAAVAKRRLKIRDQLANEALAFYGHNAVRSVLEFWNVDLDAT